MAQTQFGGGRADRRPPGGGNRPPMDVSDITFGQQINATLYSDIAERYAEQVAGEPRNPRNKPSQLRRFYDELVLLHDKVMREPKRFEEQLPFIKMLKAKVAYANGREKVDGNYRSLLCRVVDQTVDVETLGQARLFMEAFMAYYKVYRPSEA